MGLKLYTYPNNKNAFKALIAAQYVGADIEVPAFQMGVDNKKPAFLKLNPFGKARLSTHSPFDHGIWLRCCSCIAVGSSDHRQSHELMHSIAVYQHVKRTDGLFGKLCCLDSMLVTWNLRWTTLEAMSLSIESDGILGQLPMSSL